MKTIHKIYCNTSEKMEQIPNESVALVVTSPPYPMIEMWDEVFSSQDIRIGQALSDHRYDEAFDKMHEMLDRVWDEAYRILIPGGIACINIGDATKTHDGIFRLYSNHTRIIECFQRLGFLVLPDIIWRKQTNAPNKFMGSGMYPPGAYVTYEHEYILIFRKGDKRKFKGNDELKNRRESAYFWEERNVWFSDVWDLKGTSQVLAKPAGRKRSGAYPFELAYRLINMYSVKNDIVVDPFLGTGTTLLAAAASERNSIGYEIDDTFMPLIRENVERSKEWINKYIDGRITRHMAFIDDELKKGKKLYMCKSHDMYVKTRQEADILIKKVKDIDIISESQYSFEYDQEPLHP